MTATLLRAGALDAQICVPEGYSDAQVIVFAESAYPCGTADGWQIRRQGDPLLAGADERVPCARHAGHVHVVLDA